MPDSSSFEIAMFQAALDTASDAVLWIDREGRLAYVNERACTSLGYTRRELLERRIWDIDVGTTREAWAASWAPTMHEGMTESKYRRRDSTLLPVEVSARDLEVGGRRLRVAFVRNISERKAVTDALRRTQAAVDRAREGIFWVNSEGRFVYVNDAACESLEYTREELLRLTVPDIDPKVPPEVWKRDWLRSRENRSFVAETIHKTKSGRQFPVEVAISFMQFEGEEYNCVYTRDITERKRSEEVRAKLESQLLHAQKLESIGRLAGGVAHDFNNMLSVILGYTELIANRLPTGDPLLADLHEITKAACRSRDTTRQLLAFSRRQLIAPKPVDLNELVYSAKNALLRLIGEDIDLRFEPAGDLWQISFDPSQIEQMLVNLIVNARDALPNGGTITIATSNVRLDEASCRDRLEAMPGEYVVLTVRDDGVGMETDVVAHIFEPFFSTKEMGKGTGLGLATVYGMVKQNEGFVLVDTAPGCGSTFQLYIPRMRTEPVQSRVAAEGGASRGKGTILIVEDDEMVRNLTRSMLESLGYQVLVAPTPSVALRLCNSGDTVIDLLMADVVMPEMKGPELGERARAIRPGLRVLFMSGYTSNVLVRHGGGGEDVNFLQKPFTTAELARSVEDAMRSNIVGRDPQLRGEGAAGAAKAQPK
jgi:PAS domain S-box-containing protein